MTARSYPPAAEGSVVDFLLCTVQMIHQNMKVFCRRLICFMYIFVYIYKFKQVKRKKEKLQKHSLDEKQSSFHGSILIIKRFLHRNKKLVASCIEIQKDILTLIYLATKSVF